MNSDYNFSVLKTVLRIKVGNQLIWKKRVNQQTEFIHLLEESFGTEITTNSFSFYPKKIYFSTPLTTDPEYTKQMTPTWKKIIRLVEKQGWEVYAPFTVSNPHANTPDTLSSYEIRDLDHIQVLTSEVALFDFNRPSHGVGQEVEMSVFMPKIGFAYTKVSRMVKGMPGLLLLSYSKEEDLLSLLKRIFTRTSYKKEPFYIDKYIHHPAPSVFKGRICLNCQLSARLHVA